MNQVNCVFINNVFFFPSLPTYQGMEELPDYNKITFPENPPIPLETVVPDASLEALNLLKRFLVYPSKQRISATEVSY